MRTEDVLALTGRLLLAVIFLASAFGKITNFDATLKFMEAHAMPMTAFFCACIQVSNTWRTCSRTLKSPADRAFSKVSRAFLYSVNAPGIAVGCGRYVVAGGV